jgi:hypothetical protein
MLSDEPLLSDHRYICFQIGNITTNYVTFRNTKGTKRESHKDDLKGNLEIISCKICTIKDTDRSTDQLQRAIVLSYYQNCPAKTTHSPWMVPWWNKKLSGLSAETRKLFNIAKRTGPNYCEIPLHCVRGLAKSPVHSPKVVREDKSVYQSKQDGNYTFH